MPCGEHVLVKRLMKGFYNMRPNTPRYNYTWDPEKVLSFLDKWTPPEDLTFKELTYKVLMLVALITGHRMQTLHCMDINCMQKLDDRYRFIIEQSIKSSKPGSAQPVLILPRFEANLDRCIYRFLTCFLDRTVDLRDNHSKLFISINKPHKPVTKETISKWIKNILGEAGINLDIFKPHSTRAASTSSASRLAVPIQSIMKAATWKKDSVFRKFYEKPLDTEDQYALTILNNDKN